MLKSLRGARRSPTARLPSSSHLRGGGGGGDFKWYAATLSQESRVKCQKLREHFDLKLWRQPSRTKRVSSVKNCGKAAILMFWWQLSRTKRASSREYCDLKLPRQPSRARSGCQVSKKPGSNVSYRLWKLPEKCVTVVETKVGIAKLCRCPRRRRWKLPKYATVVQKKVDVAKRVCRPK